MANKQQKKTIPEAQQRPAAKNVSAQATTSNTGGKYTLVTKLAFLLGIIAFLVYANTLKNGFVLDDFTVIKDNTITTKGISAIPEIFATPYRKGWFTTSNDLYRPLSLVMFAIEYEFFGLNPTPGHFMNVLIFAGCVVLLFLFLVKLFDGKQIGVSFACSLLFALHPIHTEVVANIKSRDELLCFFFAFLSLNVFMNYMKTGKMAQLVLGAFCFFLSFMSKETVVTFLAIFPLVFFFYSNGNKQRALYITGSAVVVTVLFLIIRISILTAYHANNTSDIRFIDNALANPFLTYGSRIATAVLILGHYIRLLVVPHPLICDYSYSSIPFVEFSNLGVLVSLLFYVFLAVIGVRLLLKKQQNLWAFGILFYLITISLFSNIPFLIGSTMGERFLFFSSVGYCLVAALALRLLAGKNADEAGMGMLKNTAVVAVLGIVSLVYAGLTINRNGDWFDNITLFQADVVKVPNDSRLNYYTGAELVQTVARNETDPNKQRQHYLDAIGHLKQAIAYYPDYDDAHTSIGDAYFRIEQYDSAEKHDLIAIKLNPKSIIPVNNLAGVYFGRKRYQEAIAICRQGLEYNPNYVNTFSNMGLCYMRMGMFDSAVSVLNKAISIDPNFVGAYDNLSLTYRAAGNVQEATKYEQLAKKLNSGYRF